jgi:hypothetical protein
MNKERCGRVKVAGRSVTSQLPLFVLRTTMVPPPALLLVFLFSHLLKGSADSDNLHHTKHFWLANVGERELESNIAVSSKAVLHHAGTNEERKYSIAPAYSCNQY